MILIKKKFIEKFLKFITENDLIKENDKIIVAVSGGTDSIALLLLLLSIKDKYNLSLISAHLNHSLRGKEADNDEKFVKEISLKFDIPFTSKKINIKKLKPNKYSIEEFARKKRYEFLEEIRKKYKFNKIATAHHQDDSIENFFLNILNGSGINGLTGIPVRRDKIIRPLLKFKKEELEEILNDLKINYRIDKSNFDTKIPRNWIRHKLIPFIEKNYKPIKKNILNLIDIAYYENEFFENYISKFTTNLKNNYSGFFIEKKILEITEIAIIRRILYKIMENIIQKEKVNFNLINFFSTKIINKIYKARFNNILMWQYKNFVYFSDKNKINKYYYKINITDKKEILLKELNLKVTFTISNKYPLSFKKNIIYVKLSKKIKEIKIRSKQSGDKILLLNTTYKKNIKKLFIDLKIPEILRDLIPLIEIEDEIVGIYLYFSPLFLTNKISHPYYITKGDKFLEISFTPNK